MRYLPLYVVKEGFRGSFFCIRVRVSEEGDVQKCRSFQLRSKSYFREKSRIFSRRHPHIHKLGKKIYLSPEQYESKKKFCLGCLRNHIIKERNRQRKEGMYPPLSWDCIKGCMDVSEFLGGKSVPYSLWHISPIS